MSEFLLLLFGCLTAIYVAWKLARQKLYSERVVFDTVLLVLVAALIGSRTIFVLFHLNQFGFNVLKWVVIGLYPGLSLSGAILGAAFVLWLLSDKKTLVPFPELADLLTRTFLIVAPFALVALWLVSPEKGKEWGMSLPVFGGVHPVTFYRIMATLALGIITVLFRKKRKLAAGTYSAFVWFWLIVSYFLIDFFKEIDVYYWKFSVDQWIYSILLVVIAVILTFQIKRKAFFARTK